MDIQSVYQKAFRYAAEKHTDLQQTLPDSIKRANGICELCNSPAPFKKPDGTPFLEVHHWIALSENGEDTVANTAALCPNCHKEAHFGINKEKIKLYRTIQ